MIVSKFFQECHSQVVLTMNPAYYQALVGSTVTFKCIGVGNVDVSDIVWLYYPSGNSTFTEVIYSDESYTNNSEFKYSVQSFNDTPGYLLTTLKIRNVQLNDASYTYRCACNVYKACSSGFRPIADANLIAYTTTTSTTTTSIFQELFILLIRSLIRKFFLSYYFYDQHNTN